jgi:adenine-specific DNA-methyltransferase
MSPVMMPTSAVDTASLRKARGAFFTPLPLAQYITDWAVRSSDDQILEPSCGEAAFLLAAVERLAKLHDPSTLPLGLGRLDGVELHEASAEAAKKLLRQAGVDARVQVGDFFTVEPTGSYDAVVGNPPYVRYQDFAGDARTRSRAAALRAGVSLTGLASSWAAFTIHSALFLRPGGRLGLVLPAELLTVNYAAEVRKFLLDRFSQVRLVLFDERVFPDVQEEVVLLLADGYAPSGNGGTDECELVQVRAAADLSSSVVGRSWKPDTRDGKWTPSLLQAAALTAYTSAAGGSDFTVLDEWGDTTLGMVTGNNRYFALSPRRVRELGLADGDLVQISPPGSRHLRGLTFTQSALTEMGSSGSAIYLFRPPGEPSEAGKAFIREGERNGVHTAYKCRVRRPWWRVPNVSAPDLFLTYMNADTPRLCSNRARVRHLNSVHGVFLRDGKKQLGMDLLSLATLNSMTLVGAETVGRAYGGGMLKIEPKEADRLPVPGPELLGAARKRLSAIRPQMATHLRNGRLTEAARLVDNVLLVGELGMARADVRALREAHAELSARRATRGSKGGSRGTDR